MSDVKLLHRNTWKRPKMSTSSIKNVINKMCLQILNMYKEDLALNNLQWLPKNTPTSSSSQDSSKYSNWPEQCCDLDGLNSSSLSLFHVLWNYSKYSNYDRYHW